VLTTASTVVLLGAFLLLSGATGGVVYRLFRGRD
jgi:hypothetical protein